MDIAPEYFTATHNRSERATQAQRLVPALGDAERRFHLLRRIEHAGVAPISREESDDAQVWHFVWVLRDTFYAERQQARGMKAWEPLRLRWQQLLDLPAWTADPGWWRHPSGAFAGDAEFVVHPCHRTIGWTVEGLNKRASLFGLTHPLPDAIKTLVAARKVMNTECDCLIQTPLRLLVFECKGETCFSAEQRARQDRLLKCLDRLFPRKYSAMRIELSEVNKTLLPGPTLCWSDIEA